MWTQKLNQTFNKSKEIINDAIRSGVQRFDLGKLHQTGQRFGLLSLAETLQM